MQVSCMMLPKELENPLVFASAKLECRSSCRSSNSALWFVLPMFSLVMTLGNLARQAPSTRGSGAGAGGNAQKSGIKVTGYGASLAQLLVSFSANSVESSEERAQ